MHLLKEDRASWLETGGVSCIPGKSPVESTTSYYSTSREVATEGGVSPHQVLAEACRPSHPLSLPGPLVVVLAVPLPVNILFLLQTLKVPLNSPMLSLCFLLLGALLVPLVSCMPLLRAADRSYPVA